MRIAVISDVHGNQHALEAILENVTKQGVDEIVFLGDLVNIHPHSRACFELVMTMNCPVLQGNHEEYVYSVGTNPTLEEERFQTVRWTRAQFTPSQLETMQNLPKILSYSDLLLTHATPRSLSETIRLETPSDDLRLMFEGTTENHIVRGHNHRWFEKNWDERQLWSLESAGLPLGGRWEAQYAILTKEQTWSLEPRFVPYNFEAALAEFNKDYIAQIGVLGHIFKLELIHSKNILHGFLQQYLPAINTKTISLEQAVQQFLQTT